MEQNKFRNFQVTQIHPNELKQLLECERLQKKKII
jgi:hypothetical protein